MAIYGDELITIRDPKKVQKRTKIKNCEKATSTKKISETSKNLAMKTSAFLNNEELATLKEDLGHYLASSLPNKGEKDFFENFLREKVVLQPLKPQDFQ